MPDNKEQIIKLYKENVTTEQIAEQLNYSTECMRRIIREMIDKGELQRRERLKRVTRNYVSPEKRIKTEKKKKQVSSTKGVFCNSQISKQCVYGINFPGYYYKALCNYCEITGHSRGCDPHNCTKFEKITSDNPRKYSKFDSGYHKDK